MRTLFVLPDMIKHESLGVTLLSSCLKASKHETKLAYYNHPEFENIVRSYSPDIIAYSITTGMHYPVIRKNLELKEKFGDFLSIFGGPHATFYPQMIEKYPGIDAVCVGEGERAIVKLADSLRNGEDITQINNLWVKTKEGIVKNPVGDLISDLDELPFYDRRLFPEADPLIKESAYRNIMASRGCPYNCAYCFNRNYKAMYKGKGKLLRLMSVPRAIAELKHLLNEVPNLNFIEFHDDIFPYGNQEHFDEFYELYKKEIGINFFTYLPLRGRNFTFMKRLKDMGCYNVGIGFECADENIRKNILQRPPYTNEDIETAVNNCKQAGLKVQTTNILGFPVDNSFEIDMKTLRFNMKIKPTLALSYILYPYPGTAILQYAKEMGFFPDDAEIKFNAKSDSPFVFKNENKSTIEKNALMFGIIVDFQFLIHFHRFLLMLPKWFWKFMYFAHRGYRERVTLNANYSMKEFMNNVLTLFSYLKYVKMEKKTASS